MPHTSIHLGKDRIIIIPFIRLSIPLFDILDVDLQDRGLTIAALQATNSSWDLVCSCSIVGQNGDCLGQIGIGPSANYCVYYNHMRQ